MRQVAFFGGSFNPPHVAHQMVCLYVLETQPVDEILLVPCYRHPFDKVLASYEDRLEMCRLAAAPFGPRVQVSDVERELGGEASLTIHTLEALARRHPDVGWRIVIGADILPEREKWVRWDDIAALAPPIVVGRQGWTAERDADAGAVALPAVSSTEIRARAARGEAIDALVPRRVAAYIAARRLYR